MAIFGPREIKRSEQIKRSERRECTFGKADEKGREMSHRCHASGCEAAVPPRMHMCKRHWFMVPKALRDALWAAYVPGQERRKDPTPEYLNAALACVRAVREKERADGR